MVTVLLEYLKYTLCVELGIISIRKDITLKLQHVLQYIDIFRGIFCSPKVSSNPLYLTGSLQINLQIKIWYVLSRKLVYCIDLQKEKTVFKHPWLHGPFLKLCLPDTVAHTHQILIHHMSFTQDIGLQGPRFFLLFFTHNFVIKIQLIALNT